MNIRSGEADAWVFLRVHGRLPCVEDSLVWVAAASDRLLPVVTGGCGSIAAGRDYGVTGKAACKRWSARMQMLGQEECNRVVKPVQLRINHGAPAGGCSPVAFSCSPVRTQPFLPSGRPFRVGLLPL